MFFPASLLASTKNQLGLWVRSHHCHLLLIYYYYALKLILILLCHGGLKAESGTAVKVRSAQLVPKAVYRSSCGG